MILYQSKQKGVSMKLKKSFLVLAICTIFAIPLFAQESLENPVEYSIGVDFAFYPKWTKIGTGTQTNVLRFAEFGGIYNNLEGRVNLSASYTIPTPLGSNFLLNSANVNVTETLEITPVSIAPITSISFTPLPFIVFQSGIKLGTGWDFGSIFRGGMSAYNGSSYEALGAFTNLYSKYWIQGTFQFDTGAIISGDWTHIQMMYTYQTYYEGLTGVRDQQPWAWQCTDNKVNGLQEYQQVILAYGMPLVLSRVGLIWESERYYSDNVYENSAFKASMPIYNLSAMAQLKFTQKDTLTVLANFASRRTYADYNSNIPESRLITTGAEWYFRRIAFNYTHSF